ncbi:MAG: hypothetical protein AB7V40_03010, partial [Methyloceanibacter sp.]
PGNWEDLGGAANRNRAPLLIGNADRDWQPRSAYLHACLAAGHGEELMPALRQLEYSVAIG